MNTQQKHEISRAIVASLSKINYYKDAIVRLKDDRLFIDANMSCRLSGIRSTVWVELKAADVIVLLNKQIAAEKINLSILEKKIK